jgi:hypothetical protein
VEAVFLKGQIMKTVITYKTMKIFVVSLIISCGFVIAESQSGRVPNKFSPVDVNEIPKILNMISDNTQNNYKLIRTWEGRIESQLDYIYEGKAAEKIFKSSTQGIGETPLSVLNSVETITEFSLDAEKDCVFVHSYSNKPIEYRGLDTGRSLGTKGIPGEAISILTKEYYVKCKADRMRNGVVTSRKAIKQNLQDCQSCQNQPVFDPRESFNAGQPIWETIQHILKQILKDGEWKVNGHNLKVEENKTGDVIQYQIIMPGKMTEGNLIFTTMVFSSEKGFNITLFQMADVNDRIFQKGTWNYELIDGVYLPKETTHQNYMGKDGSLSYSKKMSFKNSRINQSIASETFTYKNLGLKEGDIFVDEIQKKEYRYKEATKSLEPINKE